MKSRINDARFLLTGGAVVAFVVLLAGWLLIISPQRNAAASLRAQAADAQVANAAEASKLAALARLNQDPSQLTAELRGALAALPSTSGLPELTRQVTAQAAAHDVTLNSIAVGGVTMPASDAVPGADGSTDTTTDGTDPTGATSGTTGSGLPADVVSIPITLISDGAAADQLAFLHAIRVSGPRRALVTSTQLSVPPTTGTGSIDASCTMTVSLTVFSAVRTAAEQAEYAKLLEG